MHLCPACSCAFPKIRSKNQNFRIRDFTPAFVYAPEDRFSKSCIDNTWFCKTSVSGHKLAWKHLPFQTRCIVQMPGISKMLGGTLNVEVYAMDVHVWYIYVPGICTCPIYSMYISHKRLTLLISALLQIAKWLPRIPRARCCLHLSKFKVTSTLNCPGWITFAKYWWFASDE